MSEKAINEAHKTLNKKQTNTLFNNWHENRYNIEEVDENRWGHDAIAEIRHWKGM